MNEGTVFRGKGLETFGVALAAFGLIDSAPKIFRPLRLDKLLPEHLKQSMLQADPANVWYTRLYLLILATGFLSFVIIRLMTLRKKSANASADNTLFEDYKAVIRRKRVRSFGLYYLREFFSRDLIWIDSFMRPSYWSKDPEKFDRIDRICFKDGTVYEFQYLRDFSMASVCTGKNDTSKYTKPTVRYLTVKEILRLLVVSNFFPFWAIVHVLRRLWWAILLLLLLRHGF